MGQIVNENDQRTDRTDSMNRPALPQKLIAFALLCLVIAVVLVVLAIRDPSGHEGTIATLVGLLGLAMTNILTVGKVDELDRSIKNGATERPMQNALASDPGRDAIKTAVHEVMAERDSP